MKNKVKDTAQKKEVAVQAGVVAMGTLLSRVLGLVREIVLAAIFPRAVTDAFFVAWRLPNMFRRLLGEGALSVSFIPVFIECLNRDECDENGGEEAKKLAQGVFTVLMCIVMTLTALAILFMEPIVDLIVSGEAYRAVEGKVEATVRYARWVFGFLLLISIYAFYMAILNSLKKFALPAMAPALLNVALIVGALVPTRFFDYPADGLAIAVIVGGLLQVLILIPSLVRLGYLPKLTSRINQPNVKRVFRAMGPGLIGMSILQLTTFFNVRFASEFPEGAQSWVYWADRLLELPLSLFAVSLGSALLPTLSRYWAQEDRAGRLSVRLAMGQTISYYLRLVTILAFPAAMVLFFLGKPLVEVVFMRGRFGETDVLQTGAILQVYALALLGVSLMRVVVPAYYAVKNTWFPALAAALCLIFHLVMAPVLMKSMGLPGLALSTALSAFVNLALLIIFFRKFIGALSYLSIISTGFRVALASLAMAAGIQIYHPFFEFLGGSTLARLVALLSAMAIGLTSYIFALRVLKVGELDDLIKTLKRSS